MNFRCCGRFVFAVLILLTWSGGVGATEYLVRLDGTGDYTDIQSAINACSVGDTVLVADGIYTGSANEELDFLARDIVLRSLNGPTNCILEPSFARGFNLHRGETAAAVVQGITIRGAYVESGDGGGILCDGATPTFVDVVIDDCSCAGGGGGIAILNTGTEYVSLYNCLLTDNEAQGEGGGIYVSSGRLRMYNSTLDHNTSTNGSGIHFNTYTSVDCSNNIIWGNWGSGQVTGSYGGTLSYSLIQDWSSTGSTNFDGNPAFVSGLQGDHYLYPSTSDAVDAGGVSAAAACIPTADGTVCMDQLTTRANGLRDSGQVDVGYHYGMGPEDLAVPSVFGTIQAAINAAGPDDTVLVAAGSYPENIDFIGKDITVRATGGPDATTIDGGDAGPVVTFATGEGPEAVLEGFTVTNGANNHGGGIVCSGASPTILANVIAHNQGFSSGGGIYCGYGSQAVITGNVIRHNGTVGVGAGLSCYGSNPVLTSNTFHANAADDNGGAVYCNSAANPTASNTIFTYNQAMGGDAVVCAVGGSLTLTCCDVWGQPGGDWVGGLAGQEGIDGNFSADPAYCDAAGYDLSLYDISPCLAANNPGCGQVGALGESCTYANATLVVDPEGGGDYLTIQAAVDAAFDGDTISLVDATYTGDGNRDVTLLGKAITVTSASGNPAACVMDCQGSSGEPHRGFLINSGEGVETIVTGIRITGAYANSGAGIHISGTSPQIIDCIFDNTGGVDGGGIFVGAGGNPIVRTCEFRDNNVSDAGGGVCVSYAAVTVYDCVFAHNYATWAAGGIYILDSIANISGSTFTGNDSDHWGGALHYTREGCYVLAENCTFDGNSAPLGAHVYGRVSADLDLENCVLTNGLEGSAVYRITDSTISVSCSDVWNNAGGDWVDGIVGLGGSAGNLSVDPLYCDPATGDFSLRDDSLCADGNTAGCGWIGAEEIGCYAGGSTWLVLADGSGDYPTIQAAIDASSPGDTVELGSGTFTGAGNRDLTYRGKAVTVRGQVSGSPSVIDCQGSSGDEHRGFIFNTGEDAASILEYVTVTGGYAWDGGGLHATAGVAPTIRHCEFSGNASTDDGGGVFFSHGCNAYLLGCEITGNTAADNGGGVYTHASVAAMDSCTVSGNDAVANGGGYYAHEGGSLDLVVGLIADNTAASGGGVYIQGPATSDLNRVRFERNIATGSGGAYYERNSADTDFMNCTFFRNEADLGGGVYSVFTGTPAFLHCTFAANTATTRGGALRIYTGGDLILNSCLFWGDTAGVGPEIAASSNCTLTVYCSNIQGGQGAVEDWDQTTVFNWGENCLDTYPYFCNLAAGDLYLVDGVSPCLMTENPCLSQMGSYGAGCAAPSATGDDDGVPSATRLAAACPNPFNPSTRIEYALAEPGRTRLAVFDPRGRMVRVLVDEFQQSGYRSAAWDGRDGSGRVVGAGVYFYRLESAGRSLTGKMLLLK